MGQTVKDPRVSKERGNPLGAKQDSLTVASDTAAKDRMQRILGCKVE